MHSNDNFKITRLILFFLLFIPLLSSAQLEKTWPVWAADNGSEFIAEHRSNTQSTSFVEYTYSGSDFSMGFYKQNSTPQGTLDFRYGIDYTGTSGSMVVYNDGLSVTTINNTLIEGDVLRVKFSNGRFTYSLNDEELHHITYYITVSFYPYFKDTTSSGKEKQMALYTEVPATVSPEWISDVRWRVATEVLERGQDGGMEVEYAEGSGNSLHLRFSTAKNYHSDYLISAAIISVANRSMFFIYRNLNEEYEHKQTGNWSYSVMTLSEEELYVGTKFRMTREGSSIVYYVNGEEKKRVNTDANYDIHPYAYSHYPGQEDFIKLTFGKKGGVSNNYFNSKGSYVDESTASNYYTEAAENENWNYTSTRTYNGQGESVDHLISESRTYIDDLGKVVQAQTKDAITDEVWATENLYDKFERIAISTLSAPTGNDRIEYKNNFVVDAGGQAYGTNDFEDAQLNDPNPVGTQSGTLGHWYSSYNNIDDWQATTSFPYVRTDYSEITRTIRRVSKPGDTHHMGSGKETKSFVMPAGNELTYVFGVLSRPYCLLSNNPDYDPRGNISNQCVAFRNSPKYIKTITEDSDGKQSVSFADKNGNVVAEAVSGNPLSSSSSNLRAVTIRVGPGDYHDIHITKRSSNTTPVDFSGSGLNYSIYDLMTDAVVVNNNSNTSEDLDPGFYRVVNHNESSFVTIDYELNYFDFSLFIHDTAGRKIASVAPNDVRYTLVSNPTDNHKAFSLYRYNSREELIWEQTPDEGRTNHYYAKDGKLRFSMDAQQAVDNKFSYIKYDRVGRVIETGVSSPIPSNGLEANTNSAGFPSSGNTEVVTSIFDTPDADLVLGNYTQTFTSGRLSKFYNNTESIWYSYDEFGREKWVARDIDGRLATKITEYNYDLNGNVTKVVYQRDQTDEFRHQNGFDLQGRLKSTATKTEELVGTAPVNQLQIELTHDGDVNRRIIRNGLETQTFAYTIQKRLKAINPEDMRVTDIDGGARHPFSLALHYHRGDFTAANGQWKETRDLPTSSTSSDKNSYSGNVTGARWKTRAEHGSLDLSGHFAYRYRYNIKNELYQSQFANITPYSNSTEEGRATYISDYYSYHSYDENGNILYNKRYAANIFACLGGSLKMDKLNYKYDYSDGKNRLYRIDDSYDNDCIPGELIDQDDINYTYNNIGQLITDVQENIYLEYNDWGKVALVRDGLSATSPVKAVYHYGPDGRRVRKDIFSPGDYWHHTWYSHDSENVQAIYENTNTCSGCTVPYIKEIPIYGDGRIGIAYTDLTDYDFHYELSDHLGNVRAVIREGTYNEVEVSNYTDYYPYGWELPGRSFATSNSYRHGFQGQFTEKDEETGWNTFELRSYDGRVGRWMTIDPMREFHSPYLAFGNRPSMTTDPTGGSTEDPPWAVPGGVGSILALQLKLALLEPVEPVEPRGLIATWFDGAAYALGLKDSFRPHASVMEKAHNLAIGVNSFNPLGLALDGGMGLSSGYGLYGQEMSTGEATFKIGLAGLSFIPIFSGGRSAVTGSNLVYHSTTSAGAAQNIIKGINPQFFNSASRFGKGFYLGNSPATTIAEISYHGFTRVNTIRYNLEGARLLNASGRLMSLGVKYTPSFLSSTARFLRYDGIIYGSLRSNGTNTVLFRNFQALKNGTIIH